jgi:MFS family permease
VVLFLLISTFFAGAVRPPMNAIITDILPAEKRQAGFSLQYLGINMGVALGPIIAGFLFNNLLPMLFIGDAATSLIAVYLVWSNVKETMPESTKTAAFTKQEEAEKGSTLNALLKRPQVLLFLLIYIPYCFVYTQHRFSLPLMVQSVFPENGSEKFGFLMSINALTVLFFTVGVTSLTKKFRPIVNIIFAGLLYALGFGMIAVISNFYLFMMSTIIWTIGEILVVTNFGVYIADNSPSNFRATFSALGSFSWGAGGALGTALGGKYIQSFGITSIWPLTLIVSLVSTFLMILLFVFSQRRNKILEQESF